MILPLINVITTSVEENYDTRLLYNKISKHTILVTTELIQLMNEESMKHLQTIYDICDIAVRYQQGFKLYFYTIIFTVSKSLSTSIDEMQFLERLDYLKPKFDTALLSYLNYAINEEMLVIKRSGSDPVKFPSNWLLILKIVLQGVLAEFETRYERLLEPLLLVVRFEQEEIRTNLLRRFINITAPMDLQYMKTLGIYVHMSEYITTLSQLCCIGNNMAENILGRYEALTNSDQANIVDISDAIPGIITLKCSLPMSYVCNDRC